MIALAGFVLAVVVIRLPAWQGRSGNRFENHERADRNDDEKDDQAATLAGAQQLGRAVAAEQSLDHRPLPEK